MLGGEIGETEGQLVPEPQVPQHRSRVPSEGLGGPATGRRADKLVASPRESLPAHLEFPLLVQRLSPGLFQLLYSKFTEYLEDFHIWTSVCSRPSPSGFPHTARLTVAFALLCVYTCLAALLTVAGPEQVGGPGFSWKQLLLPRPAIDRFSAPALVKLTVLAERLQVGGGSPVP